MVATPLENRDIKLDNMYKQPEQQEEVSDISTKAVSKGKIAINYAKWALTNSKPINSEAITKKTEEEAKLGVKAESLEQDVIYLEEMMKVNEEAHWAFIIKKLPQEETNKIAQQYEKTQEYLKKYWKERDDVLSWNVYAGGKGSWTILNDNITFRKSVFGEDRSAPADIVLRNPDPQDDTDKFYRFYEDIGLRWPKKFARDNDGNIRDYDNPVDIKGIPPSEEKYSGFNKENLIDKNETLEQAKERIAVLFTLLNCEWEIMQDKLNDANFIRKLMSYWIRSDKTYAEYQESLSQYKIYSEYLKDKLPKMNEEEFLKAYFDFFWVNYSKSNIDSLLYTYKTVIERSAEILNYQQMDSDIDDMEKLEKEIFNLSKAYYGTKLNDLTDSFRNNMRELEEDLWRLKQFYWVNNGGELRKKFNNIQDPLKTKEILDAEEKEKNLSNNAKYSIGHTQYMDQLKYWPIHRLDEYKNKTMWDLHKLFKSFDESDKNNRVAEIITKESLSWTMFSLIPWWLIVKAFTNASKALKIWLEVALRSTAKAWITAGLEVINQEELINIINTAMDSFIDGAIVWAAGATTTLIKKVATESTVATVKKFTKDGWSFKLRDILIPILGAVIGHGAWEFFSKETSSVLNTTFTISGAVWQTLFQTTIPEIIPTQNYESNISETTKKAVEAQEVNYNTATPTNQSPTDINETNVDDKEADPKLPEWLPKKLQLQLENYIDNSSTEPFISDFVDKNWEYWKLDLSYWIKIIENQHEVFWLTTANEINTNLLIIFPVNNWTITVDETQYDVIDDNTCSFQIFKDKDWKSYIKINDQKNYLDPQKYTIPNLIPVEPDE